MMMMMVFFITPCLSTAGEPYPSLALRFCTELVIIKIKTSIKSLNPHNNTIRQVILLPLIYR